MFAMCGDVRALADRLSKARQNANDGIYEGRLTVLFKTKNATRIIVHWKLFDGAHFCVGQIIRGDNFVCLKFDCGKTKQIQTKENFHCRINYHQNAVQR